MKKLLLMLMLSMPVNAQVFEDYSYNNRGQRLIRFFNQTAYPVACYYQDQSNFFTFSIAAWGVSPWFFQRGHYVWECNY